MTQAGRLAAEPALAAIFGCSGPDLTPDEAAFFRSVRPWGFILFARNVGPGPGQLARLVADLRATQGWNAPVFVDQEGGSVQRLRPPLARSWPDASAQTGGVAAVRLRHRLMAAELMAHGIDGNCAPVIDLASDLTHPFLKRRIWSADPLEAARIGRAAAEGLLAGGVLPVVKHLPGHGAADADSHHALPVCRLSLPELEARDFLPVRRLADMPLGMSAHVLYPALDPVLPGTLSPLVIEYLRESLGFNGLLMTDDIGMNALGGTMGERASASLAAGCDLVLHCSGDLAEMAEVAAAIGALSPKAEARAAAALARRAMSRAGSVDIAALSAELAALETGPQPGGNHDGPQGFPAGA